MRTFIRLLFSGLFFFSISCKDTTTTIYEPGVLNDPAVMPVALYTFPGAGSVGPYDGFATTVTVRFNKFMDYATLHRAVHWSSPAGDVRSDTSVVTLNQGDVASISPIRTNLGIPFRFRIGMQYTLNIDASARDVNGNALTVPLSLTFTPEPHFRVKSMTPAAGAVNVNSGLIQVNFNAAVDTSIHSQIIISPPTPGLWHYPGSGAIVSDSSQILFQSNLPMLTGVFYSMTIGAGAKDRDGNTLSGGFSSSFSTIPFVITQVNPTDGATGLSTATRTIQFTFSDAIDTSTVRSSFSISPAIAGKITFVANNMRVFTFVASADLQPLTVYTVAIDTSLHSATGARMPQKFTSSIATGAARGLILFTAPGDGDTSMTSSGRFVVVFSSPIDTQSVLTAFVMTPPAQGLLTFANNGLALIFSPIATYLPLTTYRVTLDTSLASVSGVHLTSPYTTSFRTLPFGVSSSNPSDGATHFPTSIDITVQTSEAYDTSTVAAAFHIFPLVSGTIQLQSGNVFRFIPSASLQPYTVYSVTIDNSLMSQSGYHPPAPYSFRFATGP